MVVFLSIALLASGPVAAQPRPSLTDVAEHAADPRDKMICKRFIETGSLVSGYRVCKTRAEWDHERDNIRNTSNQGSACQARAQGGAC